MLRGWLRINAYIPLWDYKLDYTPKNTFCQEKMKMKNYPYIIIVTNVTIPKRFAAVVRGFFIFVRPQYKDNIPLIEHEKVHIQQFWRTFGAHGLMYLFSKGYRLRSELEGYSVQIKKREELGKPPKFEYFSRCIADHYNLDITDKEAKILLIKEHSKL
tara:strand:- start:1411 stop:1884 length:474 start_codon:yes stop_codon:yes gene_type:complete